MAQHHIDLKAFLLADRIYVDGASGKSVIAGVFSKIYWTQFPTTFTAISCFVKASGLPKQATVFLRWVSLDEPNLGTLAEMTLNVMVSDPREDIEISGKTPPLPLSKQGRYRLQLLVGDQLIGGADVHVTDPPQEMKVQA